MSKKITSLNWTPIVEGDKNKLNFRRYDHAISETPFGKFVIIQGSGQALPYMIVATPWDGPTSAAKAGSWEAAKEFCEKEFNERIIKSLTIQTRLDLQLG